jgi:hypothetical protein
MHPADIILIDNFPLNSNNKIDRNALLKTHAFPKEEVDNNAEIQDIVLKVWSQILNKSSIDVDENFIILGGNSIHIPQIVAELNIILNARLTIRTFMENQTIRKLSNKIVNNLK